MSKQWILESRDEGVATLTFNDPDHRNAYLGIGKSRQHRFLYRTGTKFAMPSGWREQGDESQPAMMLIKIFLQRIERSMHRNGRSHRGFLDFA